MAADPGPQFLHGRDELLALAESRLASARGGTGSAWLLSGEAGIGKTRLLNATQELGRAAGFALWTAAAFPQDVQLSAGLLLDLGHTMARSDQPKVADRGRALLDDLAELPPPDEGDAHRRRRLVVLSAADHVIALASVGPAILALEDLHWCDELSLEVMTHVIRRLPELPMLVVATVRIDDLHGNAPVRSWRARLLLQRMVEESSLSRLDGEQTAALVRELLTGQNPPRRLVDLVLERSGGVPLHIEELVTAAAQGHLSVTATFVPETLADAVLQRHATLSPPAQDVAVAAAVIGRSFDLDLLASVAGQSVEDGANSVDELVDRQFLREESPGWFGFRHALVRDAVVANAPRARRRTLHARVAEVARSRVELGGDAYRSAHHEAAGQLAEAAAAADSAAARATALSAHREALDLLHRALRCHPVNAEVHRVDLLVRRAVAAAAVDDNVQAARDYDDARTLLLRAGDAVAAAALLPGLVATRHLLGHDSVARIALLDSGLAQIAAEREGQHIDSASDPGRRRVESALLAAKAAAYLVDDRLDPAIEAGEAALALSDGGDERTRLDTAATLGSVLVFAGRMDDGWARLEDTIRRARELGLEAETARGYRMLGSSASTLVEYDRAEHWLREGIEYAARTEQWNHRQYMAAHLAHVAWCRGRWQEADRAARDLLVDPEGGITTRITALHVAGFVALGRGDVDDATAALTEARSLGEEMGELQRYSPAVWGLAECAVLQQDTESAVQLTELGYAASHAVADAASLFPFLVTGTRARLGAQDPEAAQGWVDRVGTDLRARAIPGTLPAIDHATGLLHLASGRTGKARDRLEAAANAWETHGRWWEARWAALDLARCALAANRRTQASALVAEVGAAASGVASRPLLAACAELGSRLDVHDAAQPWSPLTLRELAVARLVARGLTNREIAQELRITARTAGSHLEHISAKLGTSRRAEIATWVTSLDSAPPAG